MARSAASLISTRGPRPMPPASLSGSPVSAARSSTGDSADADAVADFQIEPRQQRRIDGRAERAVVCANNAGSGSAGSVATLPNNG